MSTAGPSQGAKAPSGGSAAHEVASVGALFASTVVTRGVGLAEVCAIAAHTAVGRIGADLAATLLGAPAFARALTADQQALIAKATDYNKQSADNNSLRLNGCDPTNVASLNGTALMNAMGNIGVNIAAGAGNLQHNGLAIATAKAAN